MNPQPSPAGIYRGVNRILDANINRLKEGLRVCEEVCRFVLEDTELTAAFKRLRHEADMLSSRLNRMEALIGSRSTGTDVGTTITAPGEFSRGSLEDVLYANIQRVKESLRVLEEFSKLKNCGTAAGFQKARYRVYEIEKRAACSFSALRADRQKGLRGPENRHLRAGGETSGRRRRAGAVKG
jgi:thiamine-phosphate pyrophosphorylase